MDVEIGAHPALTRYMLKHENDDSNLEMEATMEEQVEKEKHNAMEAYAATAFLTGLNRKNISAY